MGCFGSKKKKRREVVVEYSVEENPAKYARPPRLSRAARYSPKKHPEVENKKSKKRTKIQGKYDSSYEDSNEYSGEDSFGENFHRKSNHITRKELPKMYSGDGPLIFNDSVHGHIELHPLCVKIIDTPQFQRLRNIKQLGATYYTYPGACHNRFEHCIGTCHLAAKLLRQIRLHQTEACDDQDDLCVQIAGLCHDLGHGPFSHMFDHQFIPEFQTQTYRKWKHEEGSCKMLDHLIAENDLKSEFEKYGLNFEKDVAFIKELINPPSEQPYKGRPKEKQFLYEIVCNKKNGVDVDKWDYFARDCHHLGIPNSFDHNRVISNMMVVNSSDGTSHIAARDKDFDQLHEMFHVRSMLHRRAYQHRVNTSIETMICDAMTLANDHIFYNGENGKRVKISECIDDMFAFTRLTDNVVFDIMNSESPHADMVKARQLIQRIHTRQLYQYCAGARINETIPSSTDLRKFVIEIVELSNKKLTKGDIFISVVRINYGDKDNNPLEKFLFYSKNSPGAFVIRADEVSSMLPSSFQDCYIQVFCRDKSMKRLTEQCFRGWCPSKGLTPMRGDED